MTAFQADKVRELQEVREFRERVRRGLVEAGGRWSGIPEFPRATGEGKLLRPILAAVAALPPGAPLSQLDGLASAFWDALLAIQMVHEASLLHDDILDQASHRRGVASIQAERGIHVALIQGDHLLTGAYRLATETHSLPFLRRMTRAVERTVAGEKVQGASQGHWISEGKYREVVSWKSGELFGCALALGRTLDEDESGAEEDYQMGVRVGCLYQMVDDFLDLCPSSDLGKPALQDLVQRKWTWPLAETGLRDFDEIPTGAGAGTGIRNLLFRRDSSGSSPMARALGRLRIEVDGLVIDWNRGRPDESRLPLVLAGWVERAETALAREEERIVGGGGAARRRGCRDRPPVRAPRSRQVLEEIRSEARALGSEGEWLRYFTHHGRSFRFASHLFPREEGRMVAGVYAFCRFTDDLVDRASHLPRGMVEARLAAWMELTRAAYAGEDTGVPLLSGILGETARRGVPLLYAEELIRGVSMDLTPPRYEDLEDLRRYSYRVASVVGLWLTELFGTVTPWVLRRAEAMGHAMQLTNILRDVGEDFRQGRIYLPLAWMDRHGLGSESLARAMASGTLPPGWGELMEEFMAAADAEYETAFLAIPALPRFFQGPVAVAARVYQGIHQEIRRNAYDNLRLRAHTSVPAKLNLGSRALLHLRAARRRQGKESLTGTGVSLPALPRI